MSEPVKLLPCPFCGSTDIDAEGWASTIRSGPACMKCSGSADTVKFWNKRPEVVRLTKEIEKLRSALAPFASLGRNELTPGDFNKARRTLRAIEN